MLQNKIISEFYQIYYVAYFSAVKSSCYEHPIFGYFKLSKASVNLETRFVLIPYLKLYFPPYINDKKKGTAGIIWETNFLLFVENLYHYRNLRSNFWYTNNHCTIFRNIKLSKSILNQYQKSTIP
jgi:hypothetical protein